MRRVFVDPHAPQRDAVLEAAKWIRRGGVVAIPTDTLYGLAADPFQAFALTYDHDGNLSTQVDTVHIVTGQSVLWTLEAGSHTVTNGTGSADPSAGLLFDAPLTSANPSFSFQFNQTGQFPFFCRVHEDFNMRGVVVVSDAVAAPYRKKANGIVYRPFREPPIACWLALVWLPPASSLIDRLVQAARDTGLSH